MYSGRNENQKKVKYEKYYADKVSFFKSLLKMIRRLIVIFLIYMFFGVGLTTTDGNESLVNTITLIWFFGSTGLFIHFIYYIIRCLMDDNLRL